MAQEFRKVLKSCKILDKHASFNMQSMHSTSSIFRSAKYFIDLENRDQFIDQYYRYVFDKNQESTMLECTFKQSNKPLFENALLDSNPIKIDLDFKFSLSDEERQTKSYKRIYKIKDIYKFIEIYISNLSKYVNLPSDLFVYIMEKSNPTYCNVKDIKKDGIHIILPGYLVPNVILHKVREDCISNQVINKIFTSLNCIINILGNFQIFIFFFA